MHPLNAIRAHNSVGSECPDLKIGKVGVSSFVLLRSKKFFGRITQLVQSGCLTSSKSEVRVLLCPQGLPFWEAFFVFGYFLCSSVQIDFDNVIENNAAYLAGWLKILQADSKFIFKAAAEAQKAADYILNRKPATPQDN